jgi:hypothetical protein
MVRQFFPDNYENQLKESVKSKLHEFTAAKIPDDVPIQHIIAHGTIYKEINAAAQRIKADLIIVASHRPGLGDYLLGPNAARVCAPQQAFGACGIAQDSAGFHHHPASGPEPPPR